jgi:glucokinase
LLLGLEIGGTKLQLGLGTADGQLLALRRFTVVPEAGAPGILAQITAALDPLLADAGARRDSIEAAGIGFGGPVDTERGIVTTSYQISGWDGFPLVDWVRAHMGIARVALHNDADTAGLGEAGFGAGVGLSPILYVQVGSGIGGGLIVDGRIYRGAGLGAVEIGHLWIDDPHDPPGQTLEQRASGWAIGAKGRSCLARQIESGRTPGPLAQLAQGDPERIDAALVAEAAARGDPEAAAVLQSATRAMARGLAHAITLLAPRRVILGGGVSLIGEAQWFQPIRQALEPWVFPPFRSHYDLVPAALGERVVVLGALALAQHALTPGRC